MNAIFALVLLGQVTSEPGFSDTMKDRFQTAPAVVDPSVDDGSALPTLSDAPATRQAPQTFLAADSPSTRPRTTNAVANSAPQRAVAPPAAPAVSEATQYATSVLENLLAIDEQAQSKVRKVKLVEVISQSMDMQSQAVAIGAY